MTKPTIAIIGAGLSGIALAQKIKDHFQVSIFEKSRGVGGRMATRYEGDYSFDHGAQYFTVKNKRFADFLAPLKEQGLIASWNANFVEIDGDKISNRQTWSQEYPHYVALPKMNQFGKYLAENLSVKTNVEIAKISKEKNIWQIFDQNQNYIGDFDFVVCAAPAQQTSNLMPKEFAYLKQVQNIKMQGCFALMIGLEEKINLDWQAAIIKNSRLSWVAINSSKPGRPEGFSILANSTNRFAEENIEQDVQQVKSLLTEELEKILKTNLQNPAYSSIHRWRYANIAKQSGPKSFFDKTNQLAACGDWCIQGRVESAFLSAMDLAEKLMQS